ncbi:transposase [Streptomyces olivaceus]|nr:transposase [Streptomyces olivaceus]
MSADPSKHLVPDELWELVAPLLPSFAARPQGGGTAPRDERAVFTAVVYVLTSGCVWRHLPPTSDASSATALRRFTVWTEVGLWRRLHRAVPDELGVRGEVDWISGIGDAASVRAKRGIAHWAELGRSRQEGQLAARAVRYSGHPARPRRFRCEHARQFRPQVTHPRHHRRPVPPVTTEAPTYQTPCGQSALLYRTSQLAARAWARRAHRAARHRVRRTPWSAPLEVRVVDRLTLRLPPPDHQV